jgi:hypothetical protein
MSTITVRGLSEEQLAALKREARRQGISMNRLALRRLTDQRELPKASVDTAFEQLAGTWSQQEADSFTAAIAPLEQVDPDLWGG